MPCKYTFTRGCKKGIVCGQGLNDYCSKHRSKTPLQLLQLPSLVISKIVESILNMKIGSKDKFAKLLALYSTCKDFRDAIRPLWKDLYERLYLHPHQQQAMVDLTYLQRLHLLLETGCQKCGTPRITKIYWPLPVRVCSDCVRELTVNEFALKSEYMVSNYTDERYYWVTYYARFAGERQMKVYLRKHVEKKIGCKLEEAYLNDTKRAIAQSLGIPEGELVKLSISFKLVVQPLEKDVEKEYYTNLAKKKLQGVGNIEGPLLTYKKEINRIINKSSYEQWYNKFDMVAQEYEQYQKAKYVRQAYEQGIQTMNHHLHQDPYFSCLTLEDVPGIAELFVRSTDESEAIVSEKMQSGLQIIKSFVQDNSLNKTGYRIVDKEISKWIQYPSHHPTVFEFICHYMGKYEFTSTLGSYYMNNVQTWHQVNNFIIGNQQKHKCFQCKTNKMILSDYLQHMHSVHQVIQDF